LPTFWNQDEVNGYRYGIPAERTAKVLIYNKTWANELGFSNPPTTMDDFQTQVCAAHTALKQDSDSTNDGLGGWIVDTDALTTASWAVAFGAPLQTDGKMTFSTPGTVNAMSYLRNLLDLGCAWNSKDSSPYSYFASRQALVYSADLQDIPLQQATLNIAGSKDEWMIIPYPTQGKTFILTQGPSYAILATSAEKRLASWLFIRWMSNADHIGSLVKASTTLPLGEKIIPYAIELEDSYPQWTEAVNLLQDAQLPPVDANWTTAKMIWEDAGWQLFKMDVKADQISDLTKQMDQTYSDLVGKAK